MNAPFFNVHGRNELMKQRFIGGSTLLDIADDFGITKQRVQQVLKGKFNLTAADGGFAINKQQKAVSAVAKKERDHIERWGMSIADMNSISEFHRTDRRHPLVKYNHQKRNAKLRGVSWEFTFEQWWNVWQKSGKWEERGRCKYVMSRYGDTGSYGANNVEIITHSQNVKDGFISSPVAERVAKRRITHAASQQIAPKVFREAA